MPRLKCKFDLIVRLQPLGDPCLGGKDRELIALVVGDHHETPTLGRPTRHDLTVKRPALDLPETGRPLVVDLAGLPLPGRTPGGELALGRLRLGGYLVGAPSLLSALSPSASPLASLRSGTGHPIASPTTFCVLGSRLLYRSRCLS